MILSSFQFSPLIDWVVEDTRETIQQRSSSPFCRRPLWAVLAWAGMCTLWCSLLCILSADHGVAHPPRCPEGWFWKGCRGVWHARSMQVSKTHKRFNRTLLIRQNKTACNVQGNPLFQASWFRGNFRLLTVARRDSCGPTRELKLLHTQPLVLFFK